MTPHLILIDKNIFPSPRIFKPERWIDDPADTTSPSKTSRLDKYIVAFGKGSCNCIGMHIAYAQFYMSIAAVMERYTLEMYQTDEKDVTPSRDLFTAGVGVESEGIKVIVHGTEEKV